jgi:hypothetical protein
MEDAAGLNGLEICMSSIITRRIAAPGKLFDAQGRITYMKLKGDLLLGRMQELRQRGLEDEATNLSRTALSAYDEAWACCDNAQLPKTHNLRLQLSLVKSVILLKLSRNVEAWYVAIDTYEAASQQIDLVDSIGKQVLQQLRNHLATINGSSCE